MKSEEASSTNRTAQVIELSADDIGQFQLLPPWGCHNCATRCACTHCASLSLNSRVPFRRSLRPRVALAKSVRERGRRRSPAAAFRRHIPVVSQPNTLSSRWPLAGADITVTRPPEAQDSADPIPVAASANYYRARREVKSRKEAAGAKRARLRRRFLKV